MDRRVFLSRLATVTAAGAAPLSATTEQRSVQDGFTEWMTRQLDIVPLPGEAQQMQGLLMALRFSPPMDPRVEPAVRFEPF